jgi:hypothetical protein
VGVHSHLIDEKSLATQHPKTQFLGHNLRQHENLQAPTSGNRLSSANAAHSAHEVAKMPKKFILCQGDVLGRGHFSIYM